jgi:hypothetical protein
MPESSSRPPLLTLMPLAVAGRQSGANSSALTSRFPNIAGLRPHALLQGRDAGQRPGPGNRMCPYRVRPNERGYDAIAGIHRLEAAKQLDWTMMHMHAKTP